VLKKKIGGVRKAKKGNSYTPLSPKQITKFVSSLKDGERVEVLWVDAFSERGWKTPPEQNSTHPCAVLGFFINCKDGYLRVAQNKAVVQDGQFCTYADHWGIPLGMIFGLEKF